MTQANSNEFQYSSLFRAVGYALLALSLIDIINILFPLRFTNPAWEFQVASVLVERSAVPLLGFALVLFGEKRSRIFNVLSKVCLVIGILFLLLLPLSISAAWRIDRQTNQQLVQQTTQLQNLKSKLNQATTSQEIKNALSSVNLQANTSDLKNLQQAKNQLLGRIATTEKQVQAQATTKLNSNSTLNKNSIKSGLGATIVGACFLTLWRITNQRPKIDSRKKMRLDSNLPLANE
jgi:4-amino-4-deoxy-L-arabinose transferase-like glycosyltransferase